MKSMLCPVLISRDAELRRLLAALDEAEHGQGSVVFLTGDPGVGKSRLAGELAASAASRGFHVVSGRAGKSASPLPFRPVTEVLMKIARSEDIPHSPEIADYLPALAALVPIWGRSGQDGAAEISPIIAGGAGIRRLAPYGRPRAGAVL